MRRGTAVIAIIAGVLVGGLAWLWMATQPAVAPGQQDSSPAAAAWEGVSWSRVDAAFAADGDPLGYIESLVSADGRLVAGGAVRIPGRGGAAIEMAAAFVSTDGRSWRTAVINDGLAPGETSMLMGIAASPEGLLAYGSVCCETDARAAWHSTDGLTWRRLALAGIDAATDHWIGVAGAPGGWIAIVSNGMDNRMVGSVDAVTWSAIGLDGVPISVVAGGGRFVAVGHVRAADESYDGAVWTSTDGVAWSRIAVDDAVLVNADDVNLFDVVSFANGLLVMGTQSPVEDRVRCEEMAMVATTEPVPPVAFSCAWGSPMAWHSTDGTDWTAVDPELIAASDSAVAAAVPGGPGLVGLGVDFMMDAGDAVIWTSTDGLDWSPLATLRPLAPDTSGAIAVRGRTIVLAGTHYDAASFEPRPVIWIGTIP